MIDPTLYLEALGLTPSEKEGGQQLIFAEIIGCLEGVRTVFIPFYCDGFLVDRLERIGYDIFYSKTKNLYDIDFPQADACYFGTPTIVHGQELFPDFEHWTKKKERKVVRDIMRKCIKKKYKMVIGGLGTGDISIIERLDDMGAGVEDIVAIKCFKGFTDTIVKRMLP